MACVTHKVEANIDRTMILDPAELWPDPLDCPDWPYETGTRRYEGLRGRVGAEARLDMLARHLNRGASQDRNGGLVLRAPTKAERDAMFARTFRREGARWYDLGLIDLAPADRVVEADAGVIVDAAHVRGYLRKLDALEAKAAEDKERREREQAQRAVDGYATALANGRTEIASLAEAVARHEQRIADERAFARAHSLKQTLSMGHFDAVQAARKLGIEPPPAPKFE